MVKIRVPATSANMGPGFDSMGIALTLYNYITAEETGDGKLVIDIPDDFGEISGSGREKPRLQSECKDISAISATSIKG